MSVLHLRQKTTLLLQTYQNGILSLLPNAFGKNERQYSLNTNSKKRTFLKGSERLKRSVRHLGAGIVKSPFGDCDPIPNDNLVEYIFKDMEHHMEEPAATCAVTGRSYNYGMLRMLINRCAQALLGHCGLKPREVIGLLLPNIPEFAIICHGAMEAGLTVTFVNPLYTPDEIKRQFQNAGVKMIVTVPILLEVATTIAPELDGYKSTICIGGEDDISKNIHGLQSLLTAGHESELPGINPRELALLPYSSGTTGLPKGVMLSHHNLVANLVQGNHPALYDKVAKDGSKHKVLTVLPFFHIFGFNAILNTTLRVGGHIITVPRFSPEDYIKALETYRPTFLFVVPSLLLFLATHPAITADHLSSVEGIQSGAAPLTEGMLQKFREKINRDDVSIRNGYGMTESAPVTFLMPKLTPPSKIGTIGIPYPGTEAKIVSLKNGDVLGTHETGELLVRGPQIMMGYLNNEKATAETIDEDGWLHTGDVAYYDEDAYFYIVDRCKELIKVKGNQVSPTELENLIMEIEGIIDAAVVGVPDSLAGEVPRAYVVLKPGQNINEEDVQRWVNGKVTHYKKLVGGVKFIDSIPRNPSGKILRHELKLH
nr:4-coumarate--CoA ligase-like [Leptinotarsa decemlineata]